MHFCSSEVTGTPVSLVGWSVTLNGLCFRQRVLSIYWRLNCLSRSWKKDPGIPRHSFLKANLKRKVTVNVESMGIFLLVSSGCWIRLNRPTTGEFWPQECILLHETNGKCVFLKKKKRWYKCIKVQTIFMCCLTFSLNFYYAVFKAVRCDSA